MTTGLRTRRRALPPRFVARPAGLRALGPALLLPLLLGAAPAQAGDTAHATDDVLGSVARVASGLEVANVPSPIEVHADRMEFQYGRGVLRYDGNVTVDHAGARIRSRSLEVSFDPEGERRLRKVTALGSVEVTRRDESATGEKAEYDPTAATIVLTDHARLGSGPNSLAGERVVVYLNEKRAVVQGSASANGQPQAAPTTPGSGANAGGATSGGAAQQPAATGNGRIRAVFVPGSIGKDHSGPANGAPAPANGAPAPTKETGKR